MKTANIVGNINAADSQKMKRKQNIEDEKGLQHLGQIDV